MHAVCTEEVSNERVMVGNGGKGVHCTRHAQVKELGVANDVVYWRLARARGSFAPGRRFIRRYAPEVKHIEQ